MHSRLRGQRWFDTAQICLNGHIITSRSSNNPRKLQNFCDKCGAQTISACLNCKQDIRGDYYIGLQPVVTRHSPPGFCHSCGKPYPWTAERLRAAQELSDELEEITEEERIVLKKSLDDMVRDTPCTPVAAMRFKKLVAKAGKEAAEGFRNILVDVLSETAKKLIWK